MAPNDKVRVDLGDRSYDVIVGAGNLSLAADIAHALHPKAYAAVITDENVKDIYGQRMIEAFSRVGMKAGLIAIPPGEEAKNSATLANLWNSLVEIGLDRNGIVVALGGGVVGDLAGFAAGTYLRGIDYIQVPTTLLAQVDSSVGGKTGINLPAGKNLAGLFYQPRGVVIDVLTLSTLPEREVRAGLAEVVKYGVIWDAEFFDYIESHAEDLLARKPDVLAKAILRSVEIKAAVVSSDETESGLRRILNFGHTLGHALENAAGYGTYLHGEAVAWGMAAAARIAAEMRMLTHSEADRIGALIEKLVGGSRGILTVPRGGGVTPEKLLEGTRKDKKTVGGAVHYVLPEKIGRVIVRNDVDDSLVLEVLGRCLAFPGGRESAPPGVVGAEKARPGRRGGSTHRG
jgi:3-dehydroquinate synthase